MASCLTWPVAFAINGFFTTWLSYAVDAVLQNTHWLVVEAHYNLASLFGLTQPLERFEQRVSFTVNALQYTYSLPLLVGMTLATPGTVVQRIKRCAIGGGILFPISLFGVCSEILYELASRPGPLFALGNSATVRQIYSGMPRGLLAFAYQFGLVILPVLTPVVVWASLHRDFLQQLTLNTVPHQRTKTNRKKQP